MRAFLGLGSNLGDRRRYLREAVRALPDVVAVSGVWETDPVGGPEEQGPYLNLVVELDTQLSARALLELAQRLEAAAGRVRTERWGPRTLDVDVLLVDDVTVNEPDLVVPHPRMWERDFVLAPLSELAPELAAPRDWGPGVRPVGLQDTFLDWDPLSVAEAAGLFGDVPTWWIAGGWALDLFLGEQTRAHADLDVSVPRSDQQLMRAALEGWDVHVADPPGSLRPWNPGEHLDPGMHDLWCRPERSAPWRVQLMLDETDGDDWVYRRDDRIRRPLADLVRRRADGVPYLAPEVQLLYKAARPRPKDEDDFRAVVPALDRAARDWLRRALSTAHPTSPCFALLS